MKKLDNRGWGLGMFIGFIVIFIIAILIVAYLVNNVEKGLSPKRGENLSYSEYEHYHKFEKVVSSAASDYALKNTRFDYINIEDLEISDEIKDKCLGYVLYNYSDNEYDAYLRCENYETEGFSYDRAKY